MLDFRLDCSYRSFVFRLSESAEYLFATGRQQAVTRPKTKNQLDVCELCLDSRWNPELLQYSTRSEVIRKCHFIITTDILFKKKMHTYLKKATFKNYDMSHREDSTFSRKCICSKRNLLFTITMNLS